VLLALTPALDGKITAEEWLPLEGGGYLQWEPGMVHFAGTVAAGRDAVFSFDVSGDGWLNGDDNREVRISPDGTAIVRYLDAEGREGPVWKPAKSKEALKVASSTDGGTWSFEATNLLGRGARDGRTIGAAFGTTPRGQELTAPYEPRGVKYFRFGFDSGVQVPDGLRWRSDTKLREVAREDGLTMEFEIKGEAQFATAVVRAEGIARNDLAVASKPAKSGSIEYKSSIAGDAKPGWRILQATLGGTVLRTSFKINELIEIEVDLPDSVPYSATDRQIRGRVDVRSTGLGRIDGQYTVSVDPGWTVKRGGPQTVGIYNPRGRERINLDFLVPAGSQGEFPVTFTVIVGSQVFERTVLVEVLPPGVGRPGS
jgi:hypothetical protein